MAGSYKYDVVIAGGGLGGLLCAVILAKNGKKVCVLEKNKQAGGCLQTFSVQKKVFDSCVHYIGGLGDGHTLNRIFRYAGIIDKLELKAFDPNGFDRIAFGAEPETYPQAVGTENFIDQLSGLFPAEKTSLQEYIALLSGVTQRFPMYHLRNGDGSGKELVTGLELEETIARISSNPKLRSILLGNNLLYAGVRGKTPFYVHALVMESYLHSAHKVVPGSSQITKFLVQQLRHFGGELHRNMTVSHFDDKDGRLVCAVTEQNEQFYAADFIAAIHPALLSGMLNNSLLRPAFHQRIAAIEQTTSSFMVNLVLKPGALKYQEYNLYWHADEHILAEVHSNEWPASYALYYGEDVDYPGYADRLSILTYMPFALVEPWEETQNVTAHPGERGVEYQSFKNKFADELINKVGERLPGLSELIVARSIATPLTYRDYTGTPEGAMYGIQKDVRAGGRNAINTRTRIPNLFLTGQNVNLHGVLGVSITAVLTAGELLGVDELLAKINASAKTI